jgi:hypothetical protein
MDTVKWTKPLLLSLDIGKTSNETAKDSEQPDGGGTNFS